MLKKLFIDLETTGDGSALYHDILEIYAEIWYRGVLVTSFHRKFSHSNSTVFSGGMNYKKALKHKEEKRPSSSEGIKEFAEWLTAHKRMLFISYNASFDLNHIKNWFKRNREPFDFFYRNPVCVMTLMALKLDKFYTLPLACKVSGIQYETKKLHTAKYDVELLKLLFNKLTKNA